MSGTWRQGARIQCPRCGKWHTIPIYSPGVECDCHLICPDGDKVDDCTVTISRWTGQFGFPEGAHINADDYGDDKRNAYGYCSTHSNYTYRVPIFIEFDREKYLKSKLPRSQRLIKLR